MEQDPTEEREMNGGEPQFYGSFLRLVDKSRSTAKTESTFNSGENRKILLEEGGKTLESIIQLAPSLASTVVKPQRIIHDDQDYYIAVDLLTNTYYICYRSLLMIDIDFYKGGSKSEEKERILGAIGSTAKERGLRFRVFESRNGIHAFLISHPSDYQNYADLQLMLDLNCDFYYVIYSHLRGWSVRLNRKISEEKIAYPLLGDLGTAPSDQHLEKLIDLHLNLLRVFKDVSPSTMFGN